MQIDRIKITNFKSIPEFDLNFHEMTGLWEISGVVGAGKTTIGEAILFALFGTVRGKNNDELIHYLVPYVERIMMSLLCGAANIPL